MNQSNEECGSAGITLLWPDTGNLYFIDNLSKAKKGIEFNNISPIYI